MWYLKLDVIFRLICFRLNGVRSFESFAPHFFNVLLFFSSIKTPAKIIGPRTGPRPASSIPRINVMVYGEEKAL